VEISFHRSSFLSRKLTEEISSITETLHYPQNAERFPIKQSFKEATIYNELLITQQGTAFNVENEAICPCFSAQNLRND